MQQQDYMRMAEQELMKLKVNFEMYNYGFAPACCIYLVMHTTMYMTKKTHLI